MKQEYNKLFYKLAYILVRKLKRKKNKKRKKKKLITGEGSHCIVLKKITDALWNGNIVKKPESEKAPMSGTSLLQRE
jgi:hypothetical protein